jgi:hypothetical protein
MFAKFAEIELAFVDAVEYLDGGDGDFGPVK